MSKILIFLICWCTVTLLQYTSVSHGELASMGQLKREKSGIQMALHIMWPSTVSGFLQLFYFYSRMMPLDRVKEKYSKWRERYLSLSIKWFYTEFTVQPKSRYTEKWSIGEELGKWVGLYKGDRLCKCLYKA